MLNMIFDVDGTSKMIYTTKQQRFWLKAILLPCFFQGKRRAERLPRFGALHLKLSGGSERSV